MKYDKEIITSMVKACLSEVNTEYDAQEREAELINIISDGCFIKAVKLCVENNLCNTVFLQKEMCIGYGKAITIIHAMESLKLVEPFYVAGDRNRKILPTAEEFFLYMEQQGEEALKAFLQEVLLDEAKISKFTEGLSVDELRAKIYEVCSCLTARQMECLEMRYGLKDGIGHSVEETGCYLGVTRERIRQIEAKAFKKLRSFNQN